VIRAVAFDFYGTLAHSPDGGAALAIALAEHRYEMPAGVDHRWWNDIDGIEHAEHSVSRATYNAWQEARMRALLAECAVSPEHVASVIARVDEISATRSMTAYPEVADVLASVRSRGLTIAVCSNWNWDLHEALAAAGLADCADVAVSSAWVGARKPHPRMYEHTISAVGHDPAEILFVGDTWACDVEGPRAAGMQTLYLRRVNAEPDHTAPTAAADADPGAPDLTAVLARL
jgi:putative hydrolase of the HAD superfamily